MNTRLYKDFFIRLLNPPGLLLAVISVFIFSQQRAFSQQSDTAHNVVNWSFSAGKGADGNPVLILHGDIRDGWRLYSTTMPDSLPFSRVSLDSTAGATISAI